MSASSPPRALVGILITVFAVYLGWALYVSVTDIPTYNDFEVFHYIGGVAAEGQPNIYELKTPHQQRGPFIYPVSAATLFIPLSWLPHDLAGVLFSIVKVCCLALLWWGSVRFSGRPPLDALGWLLVMLGPAIMLHRAVTSDVGNGQVNIMLAAASAGGIWLMMLSRRCWWLGCVSLAFAIAVKLTPALLLAIPLLHRRWRALGVCMAFAAALMVALPMAWFGAEGFSKMTGQYREIAARFTFDWTAAYEQTTPTELFQFARLQDGAATTMPADAPEALPVPISGYAGEQLFQPRFRPATQRFWFGFGLLAGAAYLALHWYTARRRAPDTAADWTWDLAMLCALIVLLSPRVQKAHLVLLIVPAGWLAARMCGWFAPGAVPAGSRRALRGVIAYSVVCALFLVAENIGFPVPGWELPARVLPLASLTMLIVLIALVGWHDATAVGVSAMQEADAGMLHRP